MMKKFLAVALAASTMGAAGFATAADCDLALGKKSFKACAACHKLDEGKNGVGPSLFGVVGRAVASVDGYKYSKGMNAYSEGGVVWDAERLDRYLAKPKAEVKGTKMSYGGLRKDDRRAALICYLDTIR